MGLNGLHQVGGAAVMQEEDALAQSPQRCRAELIASRHTLADVVGEVRPHVMEQQVGIQVGLHIAERRHR